MSRLLSVVLIVILMKLMEVIYLVLFLDRFYCWVSVVMMKEMRLMFIVLSVYFILELLSRWR